MTAFISFLATLVSLVLAVQVGWQFRRRRKPHQALWSAALFLFALGAGCQFAGEQFHWTPFVYRLWYLSGAVLTAAYLGQGSMYLQASRRTAQISMVVLAAASVYAAYVVMTAPMDLQAAQAGPWISGKGMPLQVRLLTPFFNIFGTAALAGGAVRSSWFFLWSGGSTARAAGTALVALGAVVVATGGTLARFSIPEALYISELLGVLLIFGGFTLTNRGPANPLLAPEQLLLRRKRITRWGVGMGVLSLFGLIASLPILPWTMGIVKDARHVYMDTVPAENRGAYLQTSQGVMQLYNWYVQPPEFPVDAPAIEINELEQIVVVQKQFSQPEEYRLFALENGREVPLHKVGQEKTVLRLAPSAELTPGMYMLVVPLDGMFGGKTYHFFRLQ